MTLATHTDAMREFAWNAGAEFPESQWLLTSYDVWVRNPHYSGPPQRHPEDDADCYLDDEIETGTDRLHAQGKWAPTIDPDFDEIPF